MIKFPKIRNLSKSIISEGGDISPLSIKSNDTKYWSQINPSVIVIDGEILVNIRCLDYTVVHAVKSQNFWSHLGPLAYSSKEKPFPLITYNFLCKLDPRTLLIEDHILIDTSRFDEDPSWIESQGLEDPRLVKWDNKLYNIGVRRDVKPNGEGRIEYQRIKYSFEEKYAKEVFRSRIDPPGNAKTYCEKNWMPIHEMPNHFVKWTNPTELILVDPENRCSETIKSVDKHIPLARNLKGSSQIIKWNDGWLSITHENQKSNEIESSGYNDNYYFSRFIYWDSEWNIEFISDEFSFIDGKIEFVAGMDHLDENFILVTFGLNDNSSYIVKIPKTLIQKMLINVKN